MPDSGAERLVDATGASIAVVTATGALKIDGSAATQPVSGTLATYPGADPTYSGVYVSVLADDAGTAASKNHISLFNPSGSNKLIVVLGVVVSNYSIASVNSGSSMDVFKLTTPAPSGGTVITPNKFLTTMPSATADVRISNPTVTTLNTNSLASFAPPFGATGVGGSITAFQGASFVLQQNEGVVFQAQTGNTNCRWNIEIIWGEK